jgi:hypothetical protein
MTQSKKGRPKTKPAPTNGNREPLQIRLSADERAMLTGISARTGESMGGVIRRLIRAAAS